MMDEKPNQEGPMGPPTLETVAPVCNFTFAKVAMCKWRLFVPPSPVAAFKINTQRLNINYKCLANSSGLLPASSYI